MPAYSSIPPPKYDPKSTSNRISKSTNASAPKNWPPEILYLSVPQYSPNLTQAHLAFLHSNPSTTSGVANVHVTPVSSTSASTSARPANLLFTIPLTTPGGPCPVVKITPISDVKHPANGQSGLFAARDLKPGDFILEYLGVMHTDSISQSFMSPHSDSDYDLSLDRNAGLAIDAAAMGNEARFINDYRGITAKPNAEFREIWSARRGERGMGVFVFGEGKKKVFKGIKKGEELLVSYGRGFWGARRGEEEFHETLTVP